MIGVGIARRYARALYEIGRDGRMLEKLESELGRVVEVIGREADFRKSLHNPLIKVEEKIALVERVFQGQLSETLFRLLRLMIFKKREHQFAAVLAEYRRLVRAEQGRLEVEVVLARPADARFLSALRAELGRKTGKQVDLRPHVKPEIIGGVILQIGDRRIDGSLRTRLDSLGQAVRKARISGKG